MQVHGHGQCRACGTNIEPCCSGDVSAGPGDLAPSLDLPGIGPELFPALFAGLGGVRASVTTEALCFALQQRLGCDLEQARDVLEAGVRVGWICAQPHGAMRLGAGPRREVD